MESEKATSLKFDYWNAEDRAVRWGFLAAKICAFGLSVFVAVSLGIRSFVDGESFVESFVGATVYAGLGLFAGFGVGVVLGAVVGLIVAAVGFLSAVFWK